MKALQDQHEDQQSEIDYLKAEIEELKRQIST
jgi:cell division protein FtsB